MTADLIQRVFGVRATVIPHPVYGTPMVVPLTDDLSECSETVADVSDAI